MARDRRAPLAPPVGEPRANLAERLGHLLTLFHVQSKHVLETRDPRGVLFNDAQELFDLALKGRQVGVLARRAGSRRRRAAISAIDYTRFRSRSAGGSSRSRKPIRRASVSAGPLLRRTVDVPFKPAGSCEHQRLVFGCLGLLRWSARGCDGATTVAAGFRQSEI